MLLFSTPTFDADKAAGLAQYYSHRFQCSSPMLLTWLMSYWIMRI